MNKIMEGSSLVIIVLTTVIGFVWGFFSGIEVATSRIEKQATAHCGAFFAPTTAEFTWKKCEEQPR